MDIILVIAAAAILLKTVARTVVSTPPIFLKIGPGTVVPAATVLFEVGPSAVVPTASILLERGAGVESLCVAQDVAHPVFAEGEVEGLARGSNNAAYQYDGARRWKRGKAYGGADAAGGACATAIATSAMRIVLKCMLVFGGEGVALIA